MTEIYHDEDFIFEEVPMPRRKAEEMIPLIKKNAPADWDDVPSVGLGWDWCWAHGIRLPLISYSSACATAVSIRRFRAEGPRQLSHATDLAP